MEIIDSILWVIPVWQSLLFALLAYVSYIRGKGNSRFFLALVMLSTAFHFAFNAIYICRINDILVYSYSFSLPSTLLILPLFHLYIKSLLRKSYFFSVKEYKHFLPAIGFLVLNLPFLFISKPERIWFLTEGFGNSTDGFVFIYLTWVYRIGFYGILYLQFFIYAFRFLSQYPGFKKEIEQHFSFQEYINLNWIKWIMSLFVVFLLMLDIMHFVSFGDDYLYRIYFNVLIIFLHLSIGFYGLLQDQIFPDKGSSERLGLAVTIGVEESNDLAPLKYKKSNLSNEKKEDIEKVLVLFMEDTQTYLKGDLSIEFLAQCLQVSSKHLSQTINERFGKNFFQYINDYRCHYAALLLTDPQASHLSVEGIASSSGFNSKSSFIDSFRRVYKCTPSEYRANQSKSAELDNSLKIND